MCCSNLLGSFGSATIVGIHNIVPLSTERTRDRPLTTGIHLTGCAFARIDGTSVIDQLWIQESAASGANVRRPALRVLLFNQAPTAPVDGSDYVVDLDRLVGVILIESGEATADAPLRKWTRIEATKHRATVNPGIVVRASTTTDLWIVVVADATFTPGTNSYRLGYAIRHLN